MIIEINDRILITDQNRMYLRRSSSQLYAWQTYICVRKINVICNSGKIDVIFTLGKINVICDLKKTITILRLFVAFNHVNENSLSHDIIKSRSIKINLYFQRFYNMSYHNR